jgi:hypothetical protein
MGRRPASACGGPTGHDFLVLSAYPPVLANHPALSLQVDSRLGAGVEARYRCWGAIESSSLATVGAASQE